MEREYREKRRIALIVQYDGTLFHGSQIQEHIRTIQGEIEIALAVLLREKIKILASGRTDAGVHSFGQVVHFDTSSTIALEKLCVSINGILDANVSVKNAFDVDAKFNARFSVISREYKYIIYNHSYRSPFMIYRAMWVHKYLDVETLVKAASYLIGEKDFASFCKKISAKKGTIREIKNIDIKRKGDIIEFVICGNAFLHHMVRIIVGTLVDIAINNKKPSIIKDILEARDRDVSGETAPPYGLYLNEVLYKPDLYSFNSAFSK